MLSQFPHPRAALSAALVLVSVAAAPLARGGEGGSGSGVAWAIGRGDAVLAALRGNPDLRAAALEIERSRSRLRWAGRLPDPALELSGQADWFGNDDGEGGFEVAFAQRFPLTSRLRLEKDLRERDVALAEAEYRVREWQLAYEVDRAWIELGAATRASALRARMLEVNEGVRAFLDSRVQVGEASPLDATQASISGQLLEQELGVAEAEAVAAGAQLAQLVGVEPGGPVEAVGGLALPAGAPGGSYDLAEVLARRADYAALRVAGERGQARLAFERSRRWDDIVVKVFARGEDSLDEPVGLDRNTFAGVGVSIPLPFRQRNQGAIEQATIDIEEAGRRQAAKVFAIRSELGRALRARAAAYRLAAEAASEAVPLAQRNLDEFRSAQQSGQASLLQVQQAQAQLLDLETSALELLKQYGLLDAEVRFLTGQYPSLLPGRGGSSTK